MNRQVVRLPGHVASAYEDFLETFRSTVEDAGGLVSFGPPLASSFTKSGNKTVMFKSCLYLKEWPSRRLSGSKRLDVAIVALEELEEGTHKRWSLKKSTIYMNYFVISNSKARLAQSLRYEFSEGGQIDHPLFHVHLTDEPISESDLRTAGFDLKLEPPKQSNECWVTTRIPTPDMTLASVLYCLVADHWKAKIFVPFAERVHSIQDRLPTPRFDTLRKSLQSSAKHFKSSHWFAHMREQ